VQIEHQQIPLNWCLCKIIFEIEKLKLEKQKLNMEKNKLALVIEKLKYEMSLQGIDFKIPVLEFRNCKFQ
jgi:hypothetical protein